MNYIIDLMGKKFGKLTVIENMGNNKHKTVMWKCLCDCGNERVIVGQSLRNGNTTSCGCLRYDKLKEMPEHLHRRELVPIKCGIYKIENPLGEVYIGHSRVVYRRWLRHREGNKKLKIHQSIKEYGWRQHKFSIEHELPLDVSDETLIQYEQLYMDLYRDCGVIMLNVKDAGSSASFSEESKLKMSLSQQKRTSWNTGVKGRIPWNKGIKMNKNINL